MRITFANAQSSLIPESSTTLLQLLVAIISQHEFAFPAISQAYYNYLSSLINAASGTLDSGLIATAIQIPLGFQSCQWFSLLLAGFSCTAS
jgi:hypothetical protein